MAKQLLDMAWKRHRFPCLITTREKTSSAHFVASRARDPTFEKLMENYKNVLKVVAIQDLILANPAKPAVSLDFLNALTQRLHLNRGAASFLRRHPHVFRLFHSQPKSQILCEMTDNALDIIRQESTASVDSLPDIVDRLARFLSMSVSKTLPVRAIFKVWRELGLPDDFEDSIISQNLKLFKVLDAPEPGTHVLKLVKGGSFTAAVENWRVEECCKDENVIDRTEIRFSFKHAYPPGMRLTKDFKAKVREWQNLPYVGPYDPVISAGAKAAEKRAVGIVHEFLSLTVEKMVEVEKISHFRKWFGIDMNIRDLFLDHPGMFYLSTKGKAHTVFLREAYERGCLVHRNPVYDARRKLFDLVVMGRRGFTAGGEKSTVVNGRDGVVGENDG